MTWMETQMKRVMQLVRSSLFQPMLAIETLFIFYLSGYFQMNAYHHGLDNIKIGHWKVVFSVWALGVVAFYCVAELYVQDNVEGSRCYIPCNADLHSLLCTLQRNGRKSLWNSKSLANLGKIQALRLASYLTGMMIVLLLTTSHSSPGGLGLVSDTLCSACTWHRLSRVNGLIVSLLRAYGTAALDLQSALFSSEMDIFEFHSCIVLLWAWQAVWRILEMGDGML